MKVTPVKAHTVLEISHPDEEGFRVKWDGSRPDEVMVFKHLNGLIVCNFDALQAMLATLREAKDNLK